MSETTTRQDAPKPRPLPSTGRIAFTALLFLISPLLISLVYAIQVVLYVLATSFVEDTNLRWHHHARFLPLGFGLLPYVLADIESELGRIGHEYLRRARLSDNGPEMERITK